MTSRTILYALALAILGANLPSQAFPQTEDTAPKRDEIRKPTMVSPEVNWRVVALRRKGIARVIRDGFRRLWE